MGITGMGTQSRDTKMPLLRDDAPFNIYLYKTMEGAREVIERQAIRFGGIEKVPHGRAHLSHQDLVSMDIFSGMTEIFDSFNRLLQIRALMRIPPRFLEGGRLEHLKFVLESHLQELAILRHRLRSHTLFVDRTILRPTGKVRDEVRPLLKKIDSVVGQRISDRNWHVHRARHEEEELKLLSVLELLSVAEGRGKVPWEPKWKVAADLTFREGRKKLKTRISNELIIVSAFLNDWARTLGEVLGG